MGGRSFFDAETLRNLKGMKRGSYSAFSSASLRHLYY